MLLMVSNGRSTAKFNLFPIWLPQIFGPEISIEQLCQFFRCNVCQVCGRISFFLFQSLKIVWTLGLTIGMSIVSLELDEILPDVTSYANILEYYSCLSWNETEREREKRCKFGHNDESDKNRVTKQASLFGASVSHLSI